MFIIPLEGEALVQGGWVGQVRSVWSRKTTVTKQKRIYCHEIYNTLNKNPSVCNFYTHVDMIPC